MTYINEEKIRQLRNKRIKLILATGMVVGMTLTACTAPQNNVPTPPPNEFTSEQETFTYYPVDVIFKNFDRNIQENEYIWVKKENGAIYSCVRISDEGYVPTEIFDLKGAIRTQYLDQSIEIPELTENQKLILTIDYQTRTINTEVVEYQLTK